MKIKSTIAAAFITACILSPVTAEELDPALVLETAVERDVNIKELVNERLIILNRHESDDLKKGLEITIGTGETGLIFNDGLSAEKHITTAPYLRLDLPEDAGASVTAKTELKTDASLSSIWVAPSVQYSQDVSRLFGLKKQDTAAALQKHSEISGIDRRILLQRIQIEKNIIQNLIRIAETEKTIVTKETSLYEKTALLENQIRTGTILRNGSIHLSRVLEIRQLETGIKELGIEQKNNLDGFYMLTGKRLYGTATFPHIRTPELPQKILSSYTDVMIAEENLQIRIAERSDLASPAPPGISMDITGGFESDKAGSLKGSAGFTGKFEDFTVSVKSAYQAEEGLSLSAAAELGFSDKRLKKLNLELADYNVEAAACRLESEKAQAERRIEQLESEIVKINNAAGSLDVSAAFIRQYLDEMKAKKEAGLIPEIEYIKAADQLRLLELDYAILNLQRYLLANTINSLTTGEYL